jgi:hypothetical protein
MKNITGVKNLKDEREKVGLGGHEVDENVLALRHVAPIDVTEEGLNAEDRPVENGELEGGEGVVESRAAFANQVDAA